MRACPWIVRGQRHEHADAPHPLGLLRARRQRPRCRAAEQTEKFAPLHLSNPRHLTNETIAAWKAREWLPACCWGVTADVRFGSFATDPFGASADHCALCY